jgi:hypothetical protein
MANEVDPDNVLAVKNAFPGQPIGLPHVVLDDGELDGNLVVLNMTFV